LFLVNRSGQLGSHPAAVRPVTVATSSTPRQFMQDGDIPKFGISISPGYFAECKGTDDEDDNHHACRDACTNKLLVRRSRRPSRQKKPALNRRPAYQSADIARPVFA
jgi:hypothetical protein